MKWHAISIILDLHVHIKKCVFESLNKCTVKSEIFVCFAEVHQAASTAGTNVTHTGTIEEM